MLGMHGDTFTLEALECLALAQVDSRSMVGWLMTGRPFVSQPMTTTGSVSRHMHSFAHAFQ